MALDPQLVEYHNNRYKEALKNIPKDTYTHDNQICYAFAHVLAEAFEKNGYETYKVCALGSKRDGDPSTDLSVYRSFDIFFCIFRQ